MEFIELKKKELLAKATGVAGKEGRYDSETTNKSGERGVGGNSGDNEERREEEEKVMVVARKWLTV